MGVSRAAAVGRLSVLAGAAWLLLLGPSAAPAAEVTVAAGELGIEDTTGVRDKVSMTGPSSGTVQIIDAAGITLPAGSPCSRQAPNQVRCPTAGLTGIVVFLGPGNDQLAIGDSVRLRGLELDGGSGNDVIEGSDLADELFGSKGRDVLRGDSGNDFFKGGPGPDRCYGEAGNDDCLGSKGADYCNGGKGKDECDGGLGRDRCIGTRIDSAFGCELVRNFGR
jgi:hypothetical protein